MSGEIPAELSAIGERLRTQDNRITAEPMFCVQVKRRDCGYQRGFLDNPCWFNLASLEWVFEKPEDLTAWEEYSYCERWETVMVAFTQAGCEEYLNLNGHDHYGEKRIYVQSFRRCPEMIAVRAFLMGSK